MFSTDFYWNSFIKIKINLRNRDTDRDTETLNLHTPSFGIVILWPNWLNRFLFLFFFFDRCSIGDSMLHLFGIYDPRQGYGKIVLKPWCLNSWYNIWFQCFMPDLHLEISNTLFQWLKTMVDEDLIINFMQWSLL